MTWSTDENPAPAPSLYEWISFEDDSPPRMPIWADKIQSVERYRAMAEYSWSIAFPASVWGVDKAIAGASYDKSSGNVRLAPLSSALSSAPSSAVSESSTSSLGPSRSSRISKQSGGHSAPCTSSNLSLMSLSTKYLLP